MSWHIIRSYSKTFYQTDFICKTHIKINNICFFLSARNKKYRFVVNVLKKEGSLQFQNKVSFHETGLWNVLFCLLVKPMPDHHCIRLCPFVEPLFLSLISVNFGIFNVRYAHDLILCVNISSKL